MGLFHAVFAGIDRSLTHFSHVCFVLLISRVCFKRLFIYNRLVIYSVLNACAKHHTEREKLLRYYI